MNRSLLALTAAVMLAGQALICHAQQPAEGNQKLSEEKAKNLAALIKTIETTDSVDLAKKAYARGSAIDRTSVALHEAHMKKMLTLGQPLTAYYPAKAINSLAPENALAWGVTGYYEARKENYNGALQATLTSLEFDIKNTSVLYNAGELVVWYEFQKTQPELSDSQKQTMTKLKENIKKLKEFSDGYGKMLTKFQEHAKVMEEFNKLIADAKKVVEKYTDDLKALGDSAKLIDEEIATHEKTLTSLRAEYRECLKRNKEQEDDREKRAAKKKFRAAKKAEEDTIIRLKSEREKLVREAKTVKSNLAKSKKDLKKIHSQVEEETKKLLGNFQWSPPAVNGVMTPEQKNIARSTAKPPTLSKNLEAEANTKLKLAVAYLKNDMPGKAAEILRKIITKYKGTKAAKEAEKLLKKLPEKLQK